VGLSEAHTRKTKFFYFGWCGRKSFYTRPSPQPYSNFAALHYSTRSMAVIGQQWFARCSNVNNDEKFRAQ